MEEIKLILILDNSITAINACNKEKAEIISIYGEDNIPLIGEKSIETTTSNILGEFQHTSFSDADYNVIVINNCTDEKIVAYAYSSFREANSISIINMYTIAPMLVRNKGLDLPATISLNGIGYRIDENGVALTDNTDTAIKITYDDLLFLFWVKPDLLSSNNKELAEYKDKCNSQSKEIDRLNQEIEKLNKKLYPVTSPNTAEKNTNEKTVCNQVLQSHELNQNNVQARFNNESISVGDIIKFGSYFQSANMPGKESIEWQVLDINDGKALLISKYGLDAKPSFDYGSKKAYWEISSLRGWLNGAFFNTAFNNNEKERIVFYTNGYTQDKVFLLSDNEAEKYFTSKDKRKCFATEYAKKSGVYTGNGKIFSKDNSCMWWLRSHNDDFIADHVSMDGSTTTTINPASCCIAVRPAIWIQLQIENHDNCIIF